VLHEAETYEAEATKFGRTGLEDIPGNHSSDTYCSVHTFVHCESGGSLTTFIKAFIDINGYLYSIDTTQLHKLFQPSF